ncbi:hypothetical protein MNBD_ACTINO01-685 [hydrothermal vent metagenome]|uniref:Uncharacterized protein n=1 Tax=hydrothermal vent metagenome TaxID=652676 RepID=A0A3B0SGY1_9ZZZZ
MLGQMILAVLLVGVALPAFGADDAPGTRIEITQVAVQAEADMQTVLNRFTYEAIQASTLEELETVRDRAHSDIAVIRDTAFGDVDALLSLFPDELTSDAADARQRIDSAARSAHDEIDDLTGQVAPSLPPAPTTTTTTTTVPRTTTTTDPTPTTTTVPRTTTTTDPTPTTTNVAVTTTTTTMTAPPTSPAPPDPPPDIGEAVVYALTPPPQLETPTDELPSVTAALRSESGLVTGAFVATMSVVMPPSVATAVMSVPIVIEILIGTVFSSVRALVVPILVLIVVGGALAWREAGLSVHRRGAPQPPM